MLGVRNVYLVSLWLVLGIRCCICHSCSGKIYFYIYEMLPLATANKNIVKM